MKKLIGFFSFLSSFFFIACDIGCYDSNACNYNNSIGDCWFPVYGCDCSDGRGAFKDECGVCSAGMSGHIANSDIDCNGACFGDAIIDCAGECGGLALEDECGICNGDNSICTDCAGVINGEALLDNCDVCDNEPDNDCLQDECGNWGGYGLLDCAGECNGIAVEDECGICNGDNSICLGCDGVINSGLVYGCDSVCGSGLVFDCAGVCNGDANINGFCGCTNSNASNYDSDAIYDDGTCCVEIWEFCYNIKETTEISRFGNFFFNFISGPIPTEINLLTNLTTLNLSYNNISGTIPPFIGNLTNLTHLDLAWNSLTGQIPSEIGNLVNLEHLDLRHNAFSGGIPQQVCDLIESNNLWMSNILDDNNLINTCE